MTTPTISAYVQLPHGDGMYMKSLCIFAEGTVHISAEGADSGASIKFTRDEALALADAIVAALRPVVVEGAAS